MADTKILQAILDKVSNLELSFNNGFKKVAERFDGLEERIDVIEDSARNLETIVMNGFKKINERLDKIGFQLSNLEDDAPTNKEFNDLETRVEKLEKHQFASP